MTDLLNEGGLGTAAAARYLNERVHAGRYSPLVIWRWMKHGALAADGQRIYLEHVRLGRKFLTSRAALSRFARRLAQGGISNTYAVGPDAGVGKGHSSDDAARAELKNNGFF